MAHPHMFNSDDALLARVRRIALSLPGAAEKVSHGRPAFFTAKVFAYFGGAIKIDGEWAQHPHAVILKLDADERAALLSQERCWVPAYMGHSGWVGIDITDDSDFDELTELIELSYRETAAPRHVEELDAG